MNNDNHLPALVLHGLVGESLPEIIMVTDRHADRNTQHTTGYDLLYALGVLIN